MAFRTLIQNQVNSAFNLIGDLAEDITFTNITIGQPNVDGTTTEYNFDSGSFVSEDINGTTVDNPSGTTVVIKGVVSKMSKDVNDNTMIIAEVILKTEDASIVDLDNYDTISFRNKTWSLNGVEDNGFAVTLTAVRKV